MTAVITAAKEVGTDRLKLVISKRIAVATGEQWDLSAAGYNASSTLW